MSRGFFLATLALCAFSCGEAKDDKKFSAGGMEVQIKGKSGKFKVYRKNAGENETNTIEVAMDSLKEKDITGNEVGKKGKVKHSINSFASQVFDFGALQVVKLGFNDTVRASKTSFTSKIGHKSASIGKIQVDTFVVAEAGLCGPDEDALWQVVPGDMKFNIELSDWTWCGDKNKAGDTECGNEVGKFVDFAIKVKGKNSVLARNDVKKKDKERSGKGKKQDFVMGGGINFRLTNLVEIDGNVTEMPEGYPKMESKGKHDTIFTFRFPRFATKAKYDPLLTSGYAAAQAQISQAVGLNARFVASIMFASLASKFVF